MGKTRRGDKEFTREQRLAKENKLLKRELSHLRKQIARSDSNHYESVKEAYSDWDTRDRVENPEIAPDTSFDHLKKVWECRQCHDGWLEIVLYSKLNETYYFRKCVSCPNRTKGKRYNAVETKGIVKNG